MDDGPDQCFLFCAPVVSASTEQDPANQTAGPWMMLSRRFFMTDDDAHDCERGRERDMRRNMSCIAPCVVLECFSVDAKGRLSSQGCIT